MKKKVINSILCSQFDRWLKSIKDEALRKEVRDKVIISGGCIASMLLNEEVNDYDFYFTDREIAHKISLYYVEQFNIGRVPIIPIAIDDKCLDRVKIKISSTGIVGNKSADSNDSNDGSDKPTHPHNTDKFHPVYFTSNAITLSDNIQLVMRFVGTAEEIHKNYDFIHCTNYWDSKLRSLVLNQEALESILCKDLHYSGSLYPIASVIRTRKFLQRGWTINAGQYLKMCFQISKLEMDNVSVLEEQLIGVDTAYFANLISIMQADVESGVQVDQDYVCKLVDSIF